MRRPATRRSGRWRSAARGGTLGGVSALAQRQRSASGSVLIGRAGHLAVWHETARSLVYGDSTTEKRMRMKTIAIKGERDDRPRRESTTTRTGVDGSKSVRRKANISHDGDGDGDAMQCRDENRDKEAQRATPATCPSENSCHAKERNVRLTQPPDGRLAGSTWRGRRRRR